MKTIPKLQFQFSEVYNSNIKRWMQYPSGYPDDDTLINYTHSLKNTWPQASKDYFSLIAKFSGIPWEMSEIKAYIIGCPSSFSNPLSIGYYTKINRALNVLVHELIHINLSQKKYNLFFSPIWTEISKEYPNDNNRTIAHIFVHAIHKAIYLNTNDTISLGIDQKISAKFNDYHRAWQIVNYKDHNNIIAMIQKYSSSKSCS